MTGRVRNILKAVETSGMLVTIEGCLILSISAKSFTVSSLEISLLRTSRKDNNWLGKPGDRSAL